MGCAPSLRDDAGFQSGIEVAPVKDDGRRQALKIWTFDAAFKGVVHKKSAKTRELLIA